MASADAPAAADAVLILPSGKNPLFFNATS
jgi:hypothetical protein